MIVAFAGHRKISESLLREKLSETVEQLCHNGNTIFLVGTHGRFDAVATSICTAFAEKYNFVQVQLIVTSINAANKCRQYCNGHKRVCTTMFDVEDVHYKQRISLSNRRMVECCDLLICYVDASRYKSGAAATLAYAKSLGKNTINIFNSTLV